MPRLRFPGFEGEWDWEQVADLLSSVNDKPYQIQTSEYHAHGKFEVVDQGKNAVVGYSNLTNRLFTSLPIIVFGDHTTVAKYRDKPFIVGGDGVKLLKCRSTANHLHYLFYALLRYGPKPEGYKRHFTILKEKYLPVPTKKDEQEIISDFLALLDTRIASQQSLVELLKKHKRWLSNALFSGKIRMARNANWKTYRLGDIVRRVTRKNGNASDVPLTISAQYGLIDQREFFSKAVASADMSGYYLLKQGEFAYNRSSSGEYPFGSIKRLERYHQGAVSTLYICFEALGDKDDAEFLKWYFDSFAWHREVGMICAEGARNHGLLNVPTDSFFDTKHTLPADKDERKKIAALMALADTRCVRAETKLNCLITLKSGLLQQLFV